MAFTHSGAKITDADVRGLAVIVLGLVPVLTRFRTAVLRAISGPLQVAVAVGIGLAIVVESIAQIGLWFFDQNRGVTDAAS